MIIVKMDNSAVECSIAASELREIGLTPEAIVNGDVRTATFMAQINKEMSEQLAFNPESEVLMMTKNMLHDGSLRIFAIKMNNEDIQKAADRINSAALGLLKASSPDKIADILSKQGSEKGEALNELITTVGQLVGSIYLQNAAEETTARIEAVSKPAVTYSRYMAEFETLARAARFSKVVKNLPIKDSTLYKMNDRYYLMLGLETGEDCMVYEIRRCGVEYADGLSVNTPEELHVTENGSCIIKENALQHLQELSAR